MTEKNSHNATTVAWHIMHDECDKCLETEIKVITPIMIFIMHCLNLHDFWKIFGSGRPFVDRSICVAGISVLVLLLLLDRNLVLSIICDLCDSDD